MKTNRFSQSISRLCLALCLAFSFALSSCLPDGDVKENGGGNNDVEEKPTPSGVKSVALYSNLPGSNLSGLYFNENGFITSDNGWMIAQVGVVPGIGNVEYIPISNWANQIVPSVDLGFVGYHPSEGFVSFYVASIGYDEYRNPFAVGLMYLNNFTGGSTTIELAKEDIEFPVEGGTQTVAIKAPKYAIYQMAFSGDWLEATSKSSVYSFIKDQIVITAKPNDTGAVRTDQLLIVTDQNKTTTLRIRQKQG